MNLTRVKSAFQHQHEPMQAHHIMNTIFAERIMQAMSQKGLRQNDLAKITGINKGSISCYVHGQYLPNAENASKIADALNVTADYLLGKSGPPLLEEKPDTIDLNEEEISIIREYRKADAITKQIIRLVLHKETDDD